MGKLKTKKGVAKRFKLNRKGKIKYSACGKGHLLSHKTAKRLRKLRRRKVLSGAREVKFLKQMLPYG